MTGFFAFCCIQKEEKRKKETYINQTLKMSEDMVEGKMFFFLREKIFLLIRLLPRKQFSINQLE